MLTNSTGSSINSTIRTPDSILKTNPNDSQHSFSFSYTHTHKGIIWYLANENNHDLLPELDALSQTQSGLLNFEQDQSESIQRFHFILPELTNTDDCIKQKLIYLYECDR